MNPQIFYFSHHCIKVTFSVSQHISSLTHTETKLFCHCPQTAYVFLVSLPAEQQKAAMDFMIHTVAHQKLRVDHQLNFALRSNSSQMETMTLSH